MKQRYLSKVDGVFQTVSRSGLPFGPTVGKPPTSTERIRRQARRHLFAERSFLMRLGCSAWSLLAWPIHVLRQIYCPTSSALSAKLKEPEKRRLVVRALLQSAHPDELHDCITQHGKDGVRHTVFSADIPSIFHWLNRGVPPPWIADKKGFADLCAKRGIPVPDILDLNDRARLIETARGRGLVIKPTRGSGSKHVSIYLFQSSRWLRCEENGFVRLEDLWEDLERKVGKHARHEQLAQPFFSARSDAFWRRTGTPASENLPCWPLYVRLVTGRSKSGETSALAAIYTINLGMEVIPHKRLDGVIDLETGYAGRPRQVQSYQQFQPECSEPLVQGFLDAKSYVKTLHGTVDGIALIGWDILFDGNSFQVLEANTCLSLLHYQHMLARPIGQTAFAPVLESYL